MSEINKNRFSFSVIFIIINLLFIAYITSLLMNTGFEFVSVYDDSYIFYQYADEFLEGNFFQYHEEMARTDGVTSKLYLALVVLIRILCPDNIWLIIISYLIGQLFFIISAWLFYQILAEYMSDYYSFLGTLFFVLTPNIQWAFYSNMDSQLFVFLFMVFLYSLAKNIENLLLLVSVLFIFTRPEAVIISLLIVFFKRKKRFLLPVVITVVYFLVRKWIFGSFQVNSYVYSTFHGDFFNNFPVILKQYFAFLFFDEKLNLYFFPGVILISLLCAIGHLSGPDRIKRFMSAIYIVFSTMIMFMNYPRPDTFLRYMTPFFTLTIFFLFDFLAGADFWKKFRKALIILLLFVNVLMSFSCVYRFAKMGKNIYFQHISVARWIDNLKNGTQNLLCGDVGVFGFMTDCRITDLVGLVTKNTAGLINYGDGVLFEQIMKTNERPDYAVLFNRLPNLSGTEIFKKVKTFRYYDRLYYRNKEVTVYELAWKRAGEAHVFPFDDLGFELDSLNIADRIDEKKHEYDHTALPGQVFQSFVKQNARIIDGGRPVTDETMVFDIGRMKKGKGLFLAWRGKTTGATLVHIFVNDAFIREEVIRPEFQKGVFSYFKFNIDSSLVKNEKKLRVRIVNPEINLIPMRETFYYKLYSEI